MIHWMWKKLIFREELTSWWWLFKCATTEAVGRSTTSGRTLRTPAGGKDKNIGQLKILHKIIIIMQVSSWWSLFSRCLQGLELLSGFEHYANVTLLTASVFFSEQINRLHHFPEHARLCSGQAQQCEADQPREDHGQPEQGARTCGGRDQTPYSAWRWNKEVQSRFAMIITENRKSLNDA